MERAVIIKPIFWRLLLWIVLPITVAWQLGNLVYQITQNDPGLTINWAMVVGILLGASLNAVVFRNKYDIVIADGYIRGVSTGFGLNTVTFPISQLKKASIYEQSVFEKIFWFHTLRSTNGQKILFPHFIYGKLAVQRVYETLETMQHGND